MGEPPEREAVIAVDEAIASLGYIRQDATAIILDLLSQCGVLHPKAVATAYRKSGTQLSADQKRSMGLRRNAFLSQEALQDMTQAGRAVPLDAHYLTVMRAFFTKTRSNEINRAAGNPYAKAKFSGAYLDCPGCVSISGQEAMSPFPPEGCNREWCSIFVDTRIDYTQKLIDSLDEAVSKKIALVIAGKYESLRFTCIDCKALLSLPENHALANDDVVCCAACGRVFGAYSAIRDAARSELKKQEGSHRA